MKYLHLSLICLVALLFISCDEVTQKGESLGKELQSAWGDTTAIRRIDARFQLIADSLHIPGMRNQLSTAFLRSVGKNDSIQAVAQVIAYTIEDFADKNASPIVDGLRDGSLTAETATSKLALMLWAADAVAKNDYIDALGKEIDQIADRLSEKDQMKLFASATSPAKLGRAMLVERSAAGADTTALDKKAEMLKDILNETQYQEFIQAYQSK